MEKNKKEMPWDFWNHNINPITGYKITKLSIDQHVWRNKHEYPTNDDIKL
jgi:hypothetical protein